MIAAKKSRLRAELLAKLKSFPAAERVRQNKILAEKFLALPEFRDSKTIGFFANESFEVATDFLISESLKMRKRVGLPRVEKSSPELEFHQIQNLYGRQ